MSITLREGYNQLTLQLRVQFGGRYFSVNAQDAVIGCLSLERAQSCEHRLDCPLKDDSRKEVSVTGVDMPYAAGTWRSIVMTKGNPEAQFLSCQFQEDSKFLLVKDCCLDCAVDHAGLYNVLIVA